MADNFGQGKSSHDDHEFSKTDYAGPGRHVGTSSDSKLPLHNSGQLDQDLPPTKQNQVDHSSGKSDSVINPEMDKESYYGPGRIFPRNVGDVNNQPKEK